MRTHSFLTSFFLMTALIKSPLLFSMGFTSSLSASVSTPAQSTAQYAADTYAADAEKALAQMVSYKTVASDTIPYLENREFTGFRHWLKNRAQQLGLEATDHGYVITISIGQGDKVLGLITHGDVQPANPAKWKKNPFTLDTESEPGKLIGRGTEDDKAPIAAALYAMKAIKDKNIALKGKIELLVYMAEESDWAPLREFLNTYQPAPLNVALDSEYPVVTAEKGWSHIKVSFPKAQQSKANSGPIIRSFKGGAFRSQIPEEAVAEVSNLSAYQLADLRQQIRQFPVEYETTRLGKSFIISVKGKAAHSSKPEQGVNAINALAESLKTLDWEPSAAGYAVKFLNQLVGTGIYGKQFGELAYQHPFMGPMTLSPTMTHQNDAGEQEVFINIRRPVGKTKTRIESEISQAIDQWRKRNQTPVTIDEIYVGEPLMVDNAPHTDTLLSIFSHFTQTKDAKPIAIGGSTNAKLFPNAVSFGPSMPGTEYTGHSEHEFITRDNFILTLKMYTAMMIEIGLGEIGLRNKQTSYGLQGVDDVSVSS